jgi:hypothetical protein
MRRLCVAYTLQHQQNGETPKLKENHKLRRWAKWILIGGYGEAGMAHFLWPPLADPFFSNVPSCH